MDAIIIFLLTFWLTCTGKKKVKDMNVYMKPLADELRKLWIEGVPAYDISATKRPKHFQLHAVMMWTISDYPGLWRGLFVANPGASSVLYLWPVEVASPSVRILEKDDLCRVSKVFTLRSRLTFT